MSDFMFILATNPPRKNPGFAGQSPCDWTSKCFLVAQLLVVVLPACGEDFSPRAGVSDSGLTYTNYRVADVPWSIHVVRLERSNSHFEIRSIHAGGGALGLTPLSDQIGPASRLGVPAAAVNGDFYSTDGAYAGDPRGSQIVDGELVSAPAGGVCFWINALGQPQVTNVSPRFQITWPDGTTNSFGLNGNRPPNGIELYTPATGASTHTTGGRELTLERADNLPWLPLRPGRTYKTRVREIHESGDTRLAPGIMVLSLGPAMAGSVSRVETGALLTISTASSPSLQGAKTAIGGGPVLVRNGKRQKLSRPVAESYEFSSMMERHPRTAIGWNHSHFFLVEVDGRQKKLSIGMTLDEWAAYLVKLGCDEAMNLDGGGSATLWYDGKVRNSPCDGRERPIANALIVVRKSPKPQNQAARLEK
jgi:Phosphodiester glycosidase